jgi:transcriptional regulator with XRE-family HTH domain
MITAGQLRASRALLGIDRRQLAEAAGLSLPTIQRMEASEGVIRGNVDSLMKLVGALEALDISSSRPTPRAIQAAGACGSRGRHRDADSSASLLRGIVGACGGCRGHRA